MRRFTLFDRNSTHDEFGTVCNLALCVDPSPQVGAYTLFATHFHEMAKLSDAFPPEVRRGSFQLILILILYGLNMNRMFWISLDRKRTLRTECLDFL